MKFISSGFYLIQGVAKDAWMDKRSILPNLIWSGSRHISPKYPDAWIFDWSSDADPHARRKKAVELMNLAPQKIADAQARFGKLLSKDRFGFPNVFVDRETAVESYREYFSNVPNVKCVELGLPESRWDQFMEAYQAEGFVSCQNNGVYKKLSRRDFCGKRSIIGYDLLGFDGADFCSFLCVSVEYEIYVEYGVRFNSLGLIEEYPPAERALSAFENGDLPMEDGFWSVWALFDAEES